MAGKAHLERHPAKSAMLLTPIIQCKKCKAYFRMCISFYFVSGDGGNDVSMIQAADCGIGIEGKVMSSIYYINSNNRTFHKDF